MSEIPAELKYTKDHEWVRLEDDGSVVVGITDHAQEALGELVYVEVPEVGQAFSVGDPCSVIESVKAASDVYAPISGELTQANETLAETPELVNNEPYDGGWLIRINATDSGQFEALLSAEAYEQFLAESEG